MSIHHMDGTYHDNIRDYLIHRAHSVRIDANLNLLNLAVYSGNFYVEFLNELLDLRLENANVSERNKAGIDLIYWENRVAIQVSVTCAPKTIREKIRNSIQKFDKPEGDWQFYFVPITDKAPDLQKDFELPDGLSFDKGKFILDITRIMELVDAKGIAKKLALSALVDRYSKDETDYLELREKLDDLLLLTWKAHRSYKLMQTDEIDQRLFPNIQDATQFEALGKRTGQETESPVWSIIRESWNEEANHPVMIQGSGGIGKTVTLFSLTNLDKDLIPAPAVYVPMFELVFRKV